MSNNTGNTVLAILVGTVIGATLGILFAPDKGSKTREKLKDGIDAAQNDLKQKLQKASKEISNQFSNAQFDLEESYEEIVSNMSHKTEEVISFLEEKLAQLKEQNAKFQK